MPPVSKDRHFDVIRVVFALAEERDGIPLDEAARAVDLDPESVRSLIDPVLYLEFRDDLGEFIDQTRAFIIDEDDIVRVDEGHWLRGLVAVAPSPLVALRLYAAARTAAGWLAEPPAALRSAMRKLEDLLEGSVVMPSDRPMHLDACVAASRSRRAIRIVYTNDAGETSTREIEPRHVYANWGKWYIQGPTIGDAVVKSWRVDRVHDVVELDASFARPGPLDIPDRFDLTEYERQVRVRLPDVSIDNLPTPLRVDDVVDVGDGLVEATLTVTGDHRLRHLLVAAGPEAVVVEDPDAEAIRRAHAAELLAAYEA
jgi:predicted DNA-binding transcriptional regulator YafY